MRTLRVPHPNCMVACEREAFLLAMICRDFSLGSESTLCVSHTPRDCLAVISLNCETLNSGTFQEFQQILQGLQKIRICKKDSHLLSAVSKLRRELCSNKFNRKLRAS